VPRQQNPGGIALPCALCLTRDMRSDEPAIRITQLSLSTHVGSMVNRDPYLLCDPDSVLRATSSYSPSLRNRLRIA